MTVEASFTAVGDELSARGLTIALMESCTGGLLSAEISSTPGCGVYYLGGVISYATEIKVWAGVREETIGQHGVVSPETAGEMAEVIRSRFQSDIGIGITGVAGPKSQDGVEPGIVYVGIDGGKLFPPRVEKVDCRGEEPDIVKARAVQAAIAALAEQLGLRDPATPS